MNSRGCIHNHILGIMTGLVKDLENLSKKENLLFMSVHKRKMRDRMRGEKEKLLDETGEGDNTVWRSQKRGADVSCMIGYSLTSKLRSFIAILTYLSYN